MLGGYLEAPAQDASIHGSLRHAQVRERRPRERQAAHWASAVPCKSLARSKSPRAFSWTEIFHRPC
eukprot:scaffold2286_cov240-Pinguiococcus_pyrenoidosus.AAC.13